MQAFTNMYVKDPYGYNLLSQISNTPLLTHRKFDESFKSTCTIITIFHFTPSSSNSITTEDVADFKISNPVSDITIQNVQKRI
jgi:hypothetical protein